MSTVAEQLAGRDATQEKTFKKWVNLHLGRARTQFKVEDFDADLRDGKALCLLAEVFCKDKSVIKFFENASNQLKKTQNNDMALSRFAADGVELFNIHASTLSDDAKDNTKVKLGMVFQLIVAYSVSAQADDDAAEKKKQQSVAQLKQDLIDWVNQKLSQLTPEQRAQVRKQNGLDGDDEIKVTNLDSAWQDGTALTGLVIALHPDDRKDHGVNKLSEGKDAAIAQGVEQDNASLQAAIERADKNLTCPALIEANDLRQHPDSNSVLTYISQFRNAVYVDDAEPEPVVEHVVINWDEPTFLNIECEALEANDLTTLAEQKKLIQTELDLYQANVAEEKVYKDSCHRKAKRMELHLRRVTAAENVAAANAAKAGDDAAKAQEQEEANKKLQEENAEKDAKNKKLEEENAAKDKDLARLNKKVSRLGDLQRALLECAGVADEMMNDEMDA